MTEDAKPVVLDEQMRKRIMLEEQLKNVSKPTFTKQTLWALLGLLGAGAAFFGWLLRDEIRDSPSVLLVILAGVLLYILLLYGMTALAKGWLRARLERQLSVNLTSKSEELQERLEENFFTNLVKINFKYIDKYYLQTQLQADKSFALCATAATLSLLMILVGIGLLFFDMTRTEPGYVATAAGLLGEFIAAVFFYLYSQTIIKMGGYHEKLVLTQNISLALKISEDLPSEQKATAQLNLIEYLSKDINTLLVARRVEGKKSET